MRSTTQSLLGGASRLILLAALVPVATAQNCPFLGPSYPANTDRTAPAFVSAGAAFDKILADSFASGKFTANDTAFAIQVFAADSPKTPIYSTYHTSTAPLVGQNKTVAVGPDSVFRVYSLSKLISVYTILAKLGDKYWDEPVSKYIPEFANLQGGNPVYDADWDQITVGSLASLMSGVGRDYAFGDFSKGSQAAIPGLRGLLDSEVPKCGLVGVTRPCTRAESLRGVLAVFPFSSSFSSPNYSNMAFQLLAYAIENITGTPFPELVKSQLIQPLNLSHTFVTTPSANETASPYIMAGWAGDFGDEAPMGGYYSSVSDMSTLGASILSSTLLPPLTTRKWMKPITHTASLYTSIGAPWEILRRAIPISNASTTTRVFDVYTKQGGGAIGSYTTLLALSPAHNIGVSIITAGGTGAAAAFQWFKKSGVDHWLAAAEQASRDAALRDFGGEYTLPATGKNGNASVVQIGMVPDEPGLLMSKLVSNGTDILGMVKGLLGLAADKRDAGMWLYPMPLVGRAFSGVELAFRGYFGLVGMKAGVDCSSWAEVDRLRYGNYPGDLAVFQSGGGGGGGGGGRGGQVSGVLLPMLNERAFRKAGTSGGIFGREETGGGAGVGHLEWVRESL